MKQSSCLTFTHKRLTWVVCTFLLWVSAASAQSENGSQAPKPEAQEVKPESPSEMGSDPSLVSILVPPFYYNRAGRRDPFARPMVDEPIEPLPKHGPFLPLQEIDLSAIQVKAILWDVRNPRALIQTENGHIHNIGLSDKIGRNNGYVATIREGEVVLVETIEEGDKVYSTTRVLPIRK